MINLEHHRLTSNGIVHRYATAGEGPPLVLLHGFPQTSREWYPLIERLADRYRIIAPEQRGIGGVPGPADGYDKHSLAVDVLAIIDAEVPNQRVTVCGHDMGAYVGFAFALANRDRTNALILVDAPVPGTSVMDGLMANPRTWHIAFHSNVDVAHLLIHGRELEYFSYFIRSRIVNLEAISSADIAHYAEAYRAPGALRAALEAYRALPRDSELNRAALHTGGKLAMPVTVVGCSETSTQPMLRTIVDEIAILGEAAVLGPSGHWLPEELPDELADVVVACARRGSTR